MPALLLVRHGRTTANAEGVLAGRTPGVHLDEHGQAQAGATGRRLADLPLAALVSSPLERCLQTATAILAQQPTERELEITEEQGLTECDYGQWQGRALADLAKEPLWGDVQERPSTVTFPGGESMAAMSQRAVAAVRRHDETIAATHGPEALWAAVSHGDVIKALLADALGMPLDRFQRLVVHPASVSVVHYGRQRPSLLAMNSLPGDLGWLLGDRPATGNLGGGAGPSAG